jgi:alkyl hydroperoxide reductase subunit AhpC
MAIRLGDDAPDFTATTTEGDLSFRDWKGDSWAVLSVDPVADHHEWKKDIEETQGTALNFPLIADEGGKIAEQYDMLHPNSNASLTVRSVFVIGPDNTVKLTLTYPPATGRNFDELLRVIDSLQLTANQGLATPADWEKGDRVIISPSIDDETARERFGDFEAQKPYLRYTDVPGNN